MRVAARLASEALVAGKEAAKLGGTTEDIDKAVHEYIISKDGYPSPIDYLHFPKSVCTSVNASIDLISTTTLFSTSKSIR